MTRDVINLILWPIVIIFANRYETYALDQVCMFAGSSISIALMHIIGFKYNLISKNRNNLFASKILNIFLGYIFLFVKYDKQWWNSTGYIICFVANVYDSFFVLLISILDCLMRNMKVETKIKTLNFLFPIVDHTVFYMEQDRSEYIDIDHT